MRVRLTLHIGQNILGQDTVNGVPVRAARGVLDHDLVLIRRLGSPVSSPPQGTFALAESFFDTTINADTWRFRPQTGGPIALSSLMFNADPTLSDSIQVVTVSVTVYPVDPNLPSLVWSGLSLERRHQMNGAPDSIETYFSENPNSLGLARTLPIVITNTNAADGLAMLYTLFEHSPALQAEIANPESSDLDRSIDVLLTLGNDGQRPDESSYEGSAPLGSTIKTGLKAFEDIDDISIVAAPGSTFGYQQPGYRDTAASIIGLLITHCAQMRYRIAVLDSGEGQSVADVRAMKAQLDSTYAALYYPWITILDPVTRTEINIPPSGAVCGIYARNDITRGVYKAPANEVVNIAIGFETLLNKAQQDVLNPLGVNCFRFFEGRGFRLWGARTISSDQEWKYVNLRRYFAYLEHSIDKGTQFAVFEPNGDLLWANVRRAIENFLLNEWQNGALLGDKPESAFFVRCDRSTMTQNDLDNGRLVCLIGVAPLRPAEYVIFRIGQWTGDRK
jgi:hypothetical protein